MAKTSKNRMEASRRYDDKAYFKTLVRFPADLEREIRDAAKASGRSLNNFLVSAVCDIAGIPEPELKEPGNKPKTTRTTRPSD